MNLKGDGMKNISVICIIIIFSISTTSRGADIFYDTKKITPISAIILVCDRSLSPFHAVAPEIECDDSLFDRHINMSPIKFVTRMNLKTIDKNFLFVSWSIFSRLLYVKKIWTTRYRRWMI